MGQNKALLIILIFLLGAVGITLADTITTPVRFVVPTTISFTISIPATNATTFSSGQTTTTIIFNTTVTTANKLNATNVVGGSPVQTANVGIFNYTNTGNTAINITINFTTALPSGVSVKAGWADNDWESSCTQANKTTGTGCVNVTASTSVVRIANLTTTGATKYREVWLWADYNNVASGLDQTVNLAHVSIQG